MADKTVRVELLVDYWGSDGVRLETNIKELDADGRVKIDPKTQAPITTTREYEIPALEAKRLVEAGLAKIPFTMPE